MLVALALALWSSTTGAHGQTATARPPAVSSAPGLGLLDVETTLEPDKTLERVTAQHCASGCAIAGYEIHLGRTAGPDTARPFARIAGRADGAYSPDRRIAGTYLHGCFAGDAFRRAYLEGLGAASGALAYDDTIERTLDDLAAHLAQHVDIEALLASAGPVRR